MTISKVSPCPNCRGEVLYTSPTTTNGEGPALLPRLGRLFSPAKLDVVVCADCGLVRLFAGEAERRQLEKGRTWTRL